MKCSFWQIGITKKAHPAVHDSYNRVSFAPKMIFTLLKIGITDDYELHPPRMPLSLF